MIEYNIWDLTKLRPQGAIWENIELRHFPFKPYYLSRPKRSVGRAQRGAKQVFYLTGNLAGTVVFGH